MRLWKWGLFGVVLPVLVSSLLLGCRRPIDTDDDGGFEDDGGTKGGKGVVWTPIPMGTGTIKGTVTLKSQPGNLAAHHLASSVPGAIV